MALLIDMECTELKVHEFAKYAVVSKHIVSYAVRSTHVSRYFFYKFWCFFLLYAFAIAPINNVALIKHRRLYHLIPCLLRVLLQLHLAWLQSAQLCCATSCAAKLRNKSLVCHQPKEGRWAPGLRPWRACHDLHFYFVNCILPPSQSPSSSFLILNNRSFRHVSLSLWNQLRTSLRQPHTDESALYSSPFATLILNK